MSKMFESQNLLSYEIEELQNKLNIYLPLSEQQKCINTDKPADFSVNQPERKHRLLKFFACLCLFAVLGVAVPSICEANNPMPIPDYNEVCQFNCGGPSFSLEGLLWGVGFLGVVAFFGSKL